MPSSLQIPPYRSALLTGADGEPVIRANGPESELVMTDRQWYLFWQNLATALNAGSQSLEGLGNMLTFGNHADRPNPGPWPDGALYVEQDRGNALYQNQEGSWQYIAGIMYGTLVPDQRPGDLGPAADAGFQFRTNVDPARAFAWSGGDWIETTPIRYGTHADRLAETVANLVSGMLWMETDRGSVIYQNQGGTWLYLAGTMWDTMSPDHRPTDLGVHDAGFDYRSTDLPAREFIWNQTAWVEVAQSNVALLAKASATLTLTTSPQNVPGVSLTLARAGQYLVIGVFYFTLASGDAGATLVGQFSGTAGSVAALSDLISGTTTVQLSATVSQQWLYTATAGAVVTLQANKSGGAGASTVNMNHTSMMALWVSP
jgi:hypothetical protein